MRTLITAVVLAAFAFATVTAGVGVAQADSFAETQIRQTTQNGI